MQTRQRFGAQPPRTSPPPARRPQQLLEKKRRERGVEEQSSAVQVPPTPHREPEPAAGQPPAQSAPPPPLPDSEPSTPHQRVSPPSTPAAFPPPPPPPPNVDPAAYYAAYAAAIAQATGGRSAVEGSTATPPATETAAPPVEATSPATTAATSSSPARVNATRERRRRRSSAAQAMASDPNLAEAVSALEAIPFQERQRQWQAHKDAERRRREEAARQAELAECSFAPNTSATGKRRAPGTASSRQRRGSGSSAQGGSVHARLHSSETPASQGKRRPAARQRYDHRAEAEAAPAEGGGRAAWVSVSKNAHGKPPRMSLEARGAGGHRGLTTAEERELEECTFAPAVNPDKGRHSATPVRSRYLEGVGGRAGSSARRRKPPIPSGLEQCTFTPKINASRGAARRANGSVFERLASGRRPASAARARRGGAKDAPAAQRPGRSGLPPRSASAARRDEPTPQRDASAVGTPSARVGQPGPPVMDMESFLAAMQGGGEDSAAPGSVGRAGSVGSRASSAGARGKRGVVLSKEEYEKRFAGFLARQSAADKARQRKLQQVEASTRPQHRPALCAKSLELVEKTQQGSFLDRVSRSAVRQEQSALQQRAAVALDPECTFAPRINPSSRKRPARTASEMSVGDALKKEATLRMMRLRSEQESLDGVTFKPAINPNSAAAQGRLRIQDDPDSYVARVQEAAALSSQRAALAKMETSRSELADCTFKPVVHDAPMFVKRIAQSMALTKAVRPPPPEESKKPDWR